jgi:hypothetical protein
MQLTMLNKYPRKFICVQSASYPTDQLDYNQLAQHIAQQTNRTPLERMTDLLKENTYVR